MSDTATTPSGTGAAPSPASNGNAHTASSFRQSLRQPSPEPSDSGESEEVPAPKAARPAHTKQAPEPVEDEDGSEEEEGSEEESEEVEASDDEAEEEDYSWLEGLKPHKQLHGVELAEIVKALAEGSLPDALLDKLKTKLKRGDEEWEDSFGNLRKNGMRSRDLTQKLQEAAKERDSFNADRDEFIGMLQNWKTNPEALMYGLENLEFPILDVAKLMAKRHRELDEMTPKERALYEEKQKYEKELAKIKYDQKRSQSETQKKATEAEGNKRADFVSNTAKTLFEKNGTPFNQNTFNVFLSKFKVIADSYPPGTAWTEEMIEWAVDDTAEAYKATEGRRQAQQVAANPPKKKQVFDSPAREQVAKAGIIKPKAPARKDGKMSSSDFRKQFLGR